MKRLFQFVPAGSSNITVVEEYMKMHIQKVAPLLLIIAVMALAPLVVNSSTSLPTSASLRHIYVAPGSSFIVEGDSEPGLNATVYLTGTNNETCVYMFEVPSDGHYEYNVTLPESISPDMYRVVVETDDTKMYSMIVTVSSADRSQRVGQMIQSTLNTFAGLKAYLAELEAEGISPPQRVVEATQKAKKALDEAQALLDSGKLEESWVRVKEAQTIIRASFQAIDQPERPPVDELQTVAMNQTLAKVREYFMRLSRSVESLREKGLDTSLIETSLEEIEALLREAEHRIREGQREEFEASIRQATLRLRAAQALVTEKLNRVKLALALRYRESMQGRITYLKESLSFYQFMIPSLENTKVYNALSLTEQKLALIKQRLAGGELDLDGLVDVSDDIKMALRNISNEDIRRALEEMNSLRTRVETLTHSDEVDDNVSTGTLSTRLQLERLRLRRIKEYMSNLSSSYDSP